MPKSPISRLFGIFLVSLPGLEPGASGLGGSRSIQLSYRDIYNFARVSNTFGSEAIAAP